jgi:Ca2+-binding RTX toxin-like protein
MTGRVEGALALALALAATLSAAPAAHGVIGDILIVDSSNPPRLVKISATGVQSVVTQENLLDTPAGVTVTPGGAALIADQDAFGMNDGGIIRVNLGTTIQSEVSSNEKSNAAGGAELFENPLGVAVAPDGDLIVADKGIQIGDTLDGRVISVNPANGAQALLAEGVNLRNPAGIVIRQNGDILVTDEGNAIPGKVVRIDPATGAQTVFAEGNLLAEPRGLTVYPNGTVFAADQAGSRVVRIRPGGAQSVVTADGELNTPYGIARRASGRLVVSDFNLGGPGKAVTVDPFTNTQSPFVSGGELSNNLSAAVVPPSCGGRPATFFGTPRRDTIRGTRFRDVFAGLGGNDRIVGRGGRDLICGNAGRDQLSGGNGRDRLLGQTAADRLIGGRGRDRCQGGRGRDAELGCEVIG